MKQYYLLLNIHRMIDKKKEDKFSKIHENERISQENTLPIKENLFHKFSSKDNLNISKILDRPVKYFLYRKLLSWEQKDFKLFEKNEIIIFK